MAQQQFQTGDIVMVKSGGPRMTVDHYDSAGMVVCTWFDAKTSKQLSFNEGVLVKAPPSGPAYAAGAIR